MKTLFIFTEYSVNVAHTRRHSRSVRARRSENSKAAGAMNKRFAPPNPTKIVRLKIKRTPESRPQHTPGRPIVRVHLLGSMRATSYLGDNVLPRGKKARAILGYLCLSGGERVPRARLAALLWDRVPDGQARTSFRQALRELTAALGPLADELISADRRCGS